MMLKLLDYQFKVTHKKGKELHVADTLSRAALKDSFESQQSDVFRVELRFARDHGFALVNSSPYHSRGNGKAESAVKIAKNILKKSREEDPYIALLAYRNTPQQGHVYYPAQRLMSRRLRDLIPMATSKLQLTVPSVLTQNISGRKQKAKAHYDKCASKHLSEFPIGERARGTEANPGYMLRWLTSLRQDHAL